MAGDGGTFFVVNKRAEWDRYISEVESDDPETITDWELRQYLAYH